MDELITAAKSPLYWITTFLFAFIVNAATPFILRTAGKLLQTWGDRRRLKMERHDRRMKTLTENACIDSRALSTLIAMQQNMQWLALLQLGLATLSIAFATLWLSGPLGGTSEETKLGFTIIKIGSLATTTVLGFFAWTCIRKALIYASAIREATKFNASELSALRASKFGNSKDTLGIKEDQTS